MRFRILFLAAGTAVGGCHLLDVTGSRSGDNCPPSNVIAAGVGATDFKQRVAKQTAAAPPDSVLDVVLIFEGAISQSDRDQITAAGGTNVSSAGTASALKAEFKAVDLAAYVANDTGRLTEAIIYLPACATF